MKKNLSPGFLFPLIVLLLTACSHPPSVPQNGKLSATEQGFVYTANEGDNSISAIDLATGRVRHIATRITPHNVQVSRDGRLLMAVGPIASMAANTSPMKMADVGEVARGRLLILDAETLAVEAAVEAAADIEIGRHPAHVVIDARGERAYATNSEDDDVSVVDVAKKRVVGEIRTGAFPHGLRISPNGREIYVANVNDNSVSVLDLARSTEAARIPVGKAPVQVSFSPDGRRVYVSLRDENSVAVVDTTRRKKIAAVAVGRHPIQDFVTPDGRCVYVANQGTDADPDNSVSVIDATTNHLLGTIKTGKGPHGVVVGDDGRCAFVTNIVDNTVSVIDTATRKVIRTFSVGERPNGITFRGGV